MELIERLEIQREGVTHIQTTIYYVPKSGDDRRPWADITFERKTCEGTRRFFIDKRGTQTWQTT